MTRPTDKELERRRTNPPATRAKLRKQTEAKVVRRQWATGPIHSFAPHAAEMGESDDGKPLKAEPKKRRNCWEYGFDVSERLVLERAYDSDGDLFEAFIVWSDDAARRYAYEDGSTKDPTAYNELALTAGRVVSHSRNSEGTDFGYDEYHYDGAELQRIVVYDEFSDGDTFRFHYNGGRLESVVRHFARSGKKEVSYKAEPPSLSRAMKVVEQRLFGHIVDVVARAGITEQAFCLLLSYSLASPYEMSLPKLVIGLERERAAATDPDPESLFNPAGFELFDADPLDLTDALLMDASCELALVLKKKADYDKMRQLYIKVAKQLNKVDWSKHMPVTDDFIVLPVDDEVAELYDNAKATLEPKLRKAHGLNSPKG